MSSEFELFFTSKNVTSKNAIIFWFFFYQNFTNFNNRSAFDKALGRGKKSQINIGRTFDSDTK